MKKIITLFTLLLLAGVVVTAQNPFLKDQNEVYLKVSTDKVGIGISPSTDKLIIGSVAGEPVLGLKGYPNHYNPYITLYNSNQVPIWKLFASTSWFTIGASRDTAMALLVGRPNAGWVKINGTMAATKLQSTTGAFTNITAGTATATTLYSTTAIVNHLSATDSTGIVLYDSRGTAYRIFITSSGTVSCIVVQ